MSRGRQPCQLLIRLMQQLAQHQLARNSSRATRSPKARWKHALRRNTEEDTGSLANSSDNAFVLEELPVINVAS